MKLPMCLPLWTACPVHYSWWMHSLFVHMKRPGDGFTKFVSLGYNTLCAYAGTSFPLLPTYFCSNTTFFFNIWNGHDFKTFCFVTIRKLYCYNLNWNSVGCLWLRTTLNPFYYHVWLTPDVVRCSIYCKRKEGRKVGRKVGR